ncbi:MAG: DUF5611 family protein [Thermoplasmata archaeon]|jgi:hypothetical protein
MREYPVKRKINFSEEHVKNVLKEVFGTYKEEGEFIIVSYGSLDEIRIKVGKNKLYVETKSNNLKDRYEETIKKYNEFLEKATGYTAAERKKLLMKQ